MFKYLLCFCFNEVNLFYEDENPRYMINRVVSNVIPVN